MNVLGIGVIFAGGRGIGCFEDTLKQGWYKPGELKNPAYRVSQDILKGDNLLKKIRRSDKFSKMAVLAAADALTEGGILHMDNNRLGVILATAFGPQVTTFDFLDGLLDYGEANVSPTTFSNSVHNAAASYIARVLDIHGPCLTVTQFCFSFQSALLMAKVWLDEGRCDYCLVGAVDQYGEVLGYIQNNKLSQASDGKIKPFNFKPTHQVPGEGAAFFLVGRECTVNAFCEIEKICFGEETGYNETADLNIIDADGTMYDESIYMSSISPDIPTAAYAPLFGSMMIGSAFNCAAGASMLKNQVYYKNPVTDNPHGINLLREHKHSNIALISCIRYNCNLQNTVIRLKRKTHEV